MTGAPGPYVNDDGDVWVPRTVPWRDARAVAMEASPGDPWIALHYIGKEDADLFGFTRDCRCDEVCEARFVDEIETNDRLCRVPAYHFRFVER